MERQKYAQVREHIICDLRRDLVGPAFGDNEKLREWPAKKYVTGILYPRNSEVDPYQLESVEDVYKTEANELQDIEESFQDETENDEDEKIGHKNFKLPSTMGIGFYLGEENSILSIEILWGKYDEIIEKKENGNEFKVYVRTQQKETLTINLNEFPKSKRYSVRDSIYLSVVKRKVYGTTNWMVSIFLVNNNADYINNIMFQSEINVSGLDKRKIFICENKARQNSGQFVEYLYRNKPVFGRGFGCAASWHNYDSDMAALVKSEFIPDTEIPSVSTVLHNSSLVSSDFNARIFALAESRSETINILERLADEYESWIRILPVNQAEDSVNAVETAGKAMSALNRIRRGIVLIKTDKKIFDAFRFMNNVMNLQRAMQSYSQKTDEPLIDHYADTNFEWRPFQIAFILLNISGVAEPFSEDRRIVDLLWFPTGGGKTEAYLGIAAFLLGYRRLTADYVAQYEKDGGVTIILRYTLRLLTTQQRDRLLKMVCAAEIVRATDITQSFGKSRFSIGFWVGSQVTVNSFNGLKVSEYLSATQVEKNKSNLRKQLIQCPCCGTKSLKYEYNVNIDNENFSIYCETPGCHFYYGNQNKIPVFLIDEEIYKNFPSIIISTVDKFARLPWDEKTSMIFGNCDRYCPRHGYLMPSDYNHSSSHRASDGKPAVKVQNVRPFYPPELIIQDELHLISGPLGTIYAGYETAIEELCTIRNEDGVFVPKYIASTATIKNAGSQIRKLYAREQYSIFPAPGLSVEDSFFASEVDLDEYPFRKYIGICAPGISMKTIALRVYVILLQATENLRCDPALKDYIDPYRTLLGYFNSTRELGGMVRLLDDDVKEWLKIIQNFYNYPSRRYINRREEITSRQPSYKIPQILADLESTIDNYAYDVVLATNMIAVGMDVNRLGLMTVTGQPKSTSEYIQATSRVGRTYPGLVVTIYNPYRPRDMSHYENFTGYHRRLYNYVEGATATPFAARARDRFLHAIAVSLLRLRYPSFTRNVDARNINSISKPILYELIRIVRDRVSVVENRNLKDTLSDIVIFLDYWNSLASDTKELVYWYSKQSALHLKIYENKNRLLCDFTETPTVEKPTLNSMRGVEKTSQLYYYNP